ncbi:MAG: helix-turn-helix domain-containing protein [Pseudomonadota bacterium]|nr:helix-turn-helix domain-containing protein [Pseudomonadota bacterium]
MADAPPSDLRCVFATKVRSRRGQLGISQEELAERAGLHRTYVSQVERGVVNVSLDNIARLSAALQVEASELFVRG